MYRTVLINMPFASVQIPSLALTQLKNVLESEFHDQVSVEINYLNHDFARCLGINLFAYIANAIDSLNAGLGDWFFRQLAFPDLPDNTESYFKRYFPFRSKEMDALKADILDKRKRMDSLMEDLLDRDNLGNADIVGFTSMFMQNVASFALARKLKERNPKIIIVMGGANCEMPMGQEIVKHVQNIDYVFAGPGLKSFPEFVRCCLNQEFDKCSEIRGVYSKRNVLAPSGPGAIGEELDIDAPIKLDYELFLRSFNEKFPGGQLEPALLFETSRGCWWGERSHCTFCGLNGSTMAYRAMSSQRALDQFNALFQHAGTVSHFEAVDNILPKNYLKDVLPFVATPPGAQLFYEVKADLSEQDMVTLAKARVKRIQPGIESLSTSTLKLMKKGTSVFQNLFLLKNCALYDIEPTWNLLIGFPGEGEETYKKYVQDIPLLMHLPPPSGAFPVRFDRYSPYFVKAEEYGLDLHPLDYYRLIYPFPAESLNNLAYYFSDLNFKAQYFVEMLRWINKIKEKVSSWIVRWHSPSQHLPPRLYFKDQTAGAIIYDSRSGAVVEHQISEVGRQILKLADNPKRLDDFAKEFSHITDFHAEKEVAFLQEKRLLFQEGERFFNLVLPRVPVRAD
jgi:ribosomal peptide maturation radical SAM protein 1